MHHECIRNLKTEKIEGCSAEAYNRCYGKSAMIFEAWFQHIDALEEKSNNWITTRVNFCPYCGLKALLDVNEVYIGIPME